MFGPIVAGEGDYVNRAHAQVSSEIRGAHAFAADPEDAEQIGPYAGQLVEAIPGGQAPSGAGISILLEDLTAWRKSIPAERMEAAARRFA